MKSLRNGDIALQLEVLSNEFYADHDLKETSKNYPDIISSVKGFAKSCDPIQLKAFRTGKGLHRDIMENMNRYIFGTTLLTLKKHFGIKKPPEFETVKDSYIFRNIISAYLWSLRWIKDGGQYSISEEKIRNDLVDMSYITYATYFDGLLSFDKKLNTLYTDTLNYLHLIEN